MQKLGAVALALVLALSGCASASSAGDSGFFEATGTVSVPSGADARYLNQPCDSFRGVSDRPVGGNFDDVTKGAQVVVKDESGTTIGVTALEAGTLTADGESLACSYPFSVAGLPDAEFYAVHVGGSNRQDLQFTKSEMVAGPAIALR